MRETQLQLEVVRFRGRALVVVYVVHLLLALVRAWNARVDARVVCEKAKAVLLQCIERGRKVLQLRYVLRILGLSPARYHSWVQPAAACHPTHLARCPKRGPNQLTAPEVSAIRGMVTSPE